MNKTLQYIKRFAGIGNDQTSHVEKLISGLGGFVAILLIMLVTRQFLQAGSSVLIVASMGASAVLLFAVPHGPLSQPWPLAGGHLLSAFVGVSCYYLIPDPIIAAACAVGLAITAMYYLRCIHPPGGATALTTVIAGADVHTLGYQYLVTPVLLNVLVILLVAISFNYLFSWRRYPTSLMHYRDRVPGAARQNETSISSDDIEYALRQLDIYVDVSSEELDRIYKLALSHDAGHLSSDQIRLGKCYSNGKFGNDWSVRMIIDESDKPDQGQELIVYKVIAGKGRRSSGTMTRDDFAGWANYEVYLNENSWQRVTTDDDHMTTV